MKLEIKAANKKDTRGITKLYRELYKGDEKQSFFKSIADPSYFNSGSKVLIAKKNLLYDKGFKDIKNEGSKPLFDANIYSSYLDQGDKKIRIEFYSSKGLLDSNESFDNLKKKALYREYNGEKIYFADPLNLCKLKYNAWRNRLMNGRADKDIIDLKESKLLDYIDKDNEYYKRIAKAYHPSVITRFKSILSDAVHVMHQEYLRRYKS